MIPIGGTPHTSISLYCDAITRVNVTPWALRPAHPVALDVGTTRGALLASNLDTEEVEAFEST